MDEDAKKALRLIVRDALKAARKDTPKRKRRTRNNQPVQAIQRHLSQDNAIQRLGRAKAITSMLWNIDTGEGAVIEARDVFYVAGVLMDELDAAEKELKRYPR